MGFEPQSYTVNEADGYVTVNVSASGFPGPPFDMVDNIAVMLFTVDGTAEGEWEPCCVLSVCI